jgi:hypothetical protein
MAKQRYREGADVGDNDHDLGPSLRTLFMSGAAG